MVVVVVAVVGVDAVLGVAVGVFVVGAVGDETVGVVLLVDAVAIVGVTVVDAAGTAAVYVVDAVSVVDVSVAAAELQTFPDDAASAADQQVSQTGCL